jgi:uncharacterized caspase-like protein/LysM repeat protein
MALRNVVVLCLVSLLVLSTSCTKAPQPPDSSMAEELGPAPQPEVPAPEEPAPPPPLHEQLRQSLREQLHPEEYFRKAIVFLEEGQVDKARAALTLELERDPQNNKASDLLEQIDTPVEKLLETDHITYTIQPNDSLSLIAQRFLGDRLKFHLLAKLNGIEQPRHVYVGQRIKIPKTDRVVARLREPLPAQTPERESNRRDIAARTQEPPPERTPERPDDASPASEPPAPPTPQPQDTTPPQIVLLEPATLHESSELTTSAAKLHIVGDVTDDSRVEGLTLNNTAIPLDSQGRFQHTLTLTEPTTVVTLLARDAHGNQQTATYTITRNEPASPPAGTPPPPDHLPPRIVLLEPDALQKTSGMTTEATELQLSGIVTDDSHVEGLTLNNTAIPLDSQGFFKRTLTLTEPTTVVTLLARDAHGNQQTATYTITRKEPGSLPAIPPDVDFGRYHALVIGNNTYAHHPNLEAAVADAKAVAEVLRRRYGFRVTLLLNATREEIIGALDKLRSRLTSQDNLLIYYAGHGVRDPASDRGYWLPVDAQEASRAYWISNSDITDTLRAMTTKRVMVVADSCYAGTMTRAAVAGLPPPGEERRSYLKKMIQKRSRTALVSGGLEPVPDRQPGSRHSVFAKALLSVLRENHNILEGQQLFNRLRPRVVVNAPNTPEYWNIRFTGHEGGDFFFIPKEAE